MNTNDKEKWNLKVIYDITKKYINTDEWSEKFTVILNAIQEELGITDENDDMVILTSLIDSFLTRQVGYQLSLASIMKLGKKLAEEHARKQSMIETGKQAEDINRLARKLDRTKKDDTRIQGSETK
jgi:hypothetical protein